MDDTPLSIRNYGPISPAEKEINQIVTPYFNNIDEAYKSLKKCTSDKSFYEFEQKKQCIEVYIGSVRDSLKILDKH